MTAAELIAKLSEFAPDAIVLTPDAGCGCCSSERLLEIRVEERRAEFIRRKVKGTRRTPQQLVGADPPDPDRWDEYLWLDDTGDRTVVVLSS